MARDDFYASPFGAAYSAYMERPRLSSVISRLIWGGDAKPYYESMATAAAVPDGGTIVDCPCGAGPALRAVPTARAVNYVGVDLSPSMIRRARERAAVRGLSKFRFVEANAADLPLSSASADLFFSFWGLHCFTDPQAAIAEAARVLKPGGRLVGSSFVRGRDTLRQRLLIRPHAGDFGPLGTHPEIESWLTASALDLTSAQRSGPFLFFEATKRA
ncbi:MAG TPA: class I SAM-dependent methyltransferase [Solirubrobacterales bacterium]|nr:class I SAM-dependent methyltransferase [Solirubrobacterales bacterium]